MANPRLPLSLVFWGSMHPRKARDLYRDSEALYKQHVIPAASSVAAGKPPRVSVSEVMKLLSSIVKNAP